MTRCHDGRPRPPQSPGVPAYGVTAKIWGLAHQGGLAAVNAEITRQAAMIAYNNSFYFIALTALLSVPLTVFVRLPKRR